ncbi:hypothetical protein RRG08_063704 [Elysia crispata]|uniref:Uncharacterized protein n=1 Tax=Elysia crispata TaxID=231223 RepID=A0AAE0ZZW2_9GAST|nr:hypothetical protein RRG08_063704 [Elysia crispata]
MSITWILTLKKFFYLCCSTAEAKRKNWRVLERKIEENSIQRQLHRSAVPDGRLTAAVTCPNRIRWTTESPVHWKVKSGQMVRWSDLFMRSVFLEEEAKTICAEKAGSWPSFFMTTDRRVVRKKGSYQTL